MDFNQKLCSFSWQELRSNFQNDILRDQRISFGEKTFWRKVVCSFRVLSLCRWLCDKLSTGLLQRHMKCPEAHFEKIIVFSLFVFFGLRTKFFSEVWQKISGRLMKTVFHVYRGNFAGNCFSYLKSFSIFVSEFEKRNFENFGKNWWLGRQTFFFQLSRENICGKFFYETFLSFWKILRNWPEVSLELRNLTKNLGKFGKTACHVTRGSFWGSFFWKKMFPNSFRILRSNVAINCQKAPGSVLKTTIHVSRATVWIGTSFFETKNNYRVRFWIFSVDFLKKLQ